MLVGRVLIIGSLHHFTIYTCKTSLIHLSKKELFRIPLSAKTQAGFLLVVGSKLKLLTCIANFIVKVDAKHCTCMLWQMLFSEFI